MVDCIYWSQGNHFLIQASYNVQNDHKNIVLNDVRKIITCNLSKVVNLTSVISNYISPQSFSFSANFRTCERKLSWFIQRQYSILFVYKIQRGERVTP